MSMYSKDCRICKAEKDELQSQVSTLKFDLSRIRQLLEDNRGFLIEGTGFYQELKKIVCVDSTKGEKHE
jgi:hypothetical protein